LGPKQLWRKINSLLHPGSSHTTILISADRFKEFFTGKLKTIRQTITMNIASSTPRFFHSSCQAGSIPVMSQFSSVSAVEVEKLLSSLPNKTSQMDILPINIVKQFQVDIAVYISHLANASFVTGRFPQSMKHGVVLPLLKKPGLDESQPANYQPITNLTTVSKILERLVLVRVRSQIMSCSHFPKFQSAYRSYHSTETALNRILNDIYYSVNRGLVTRLVALDISAAFDMVNHCLLLERLSADFGFSGASLDWFSSYLRGRTFSVHIGSTFSETASLNSGVPQGSVLGPILFSLYISPISQIIVEHGIDYNAYADDLQLYTALSVASTPDLKELETCILELQTWYWHNDLLLNSSKTELIFLGTRQRLRSFKAAFPTIRLSDSEIQPSDTIKVLGVTLDCCLTFDAHVTSLVRACNFHLRALKHIRPYLTIDVAKSIGAAFVNSRLVYCNSVLYNTSTFNISRLQRVQNNLARTVAGDLAKFCSTSDLLQQLHWLPICHRIEFKLASLGFTCLHSQQPAYLRELLSYYAPGRCFRSSADSMLLDKPRTRTRIADRSFSVAVPTVFNVLRSELRHANTLSNFKTALKTDLYRRAYM
jgi:hypothetical protein